MNIPYRKMTEEDQKILAIDKKQNAKRAILPMIVGIVSGLGAVAALVFTKSQGIALSFIWIICLVFIVFAIMCIRLGVMAIKMPWGICEVTITDMRTEETIGAQGDGEVKIAHYVTVKIKENGETFETFVDDNTYANAKVDAKAYLLETGKESFRIVVVE